MSRPNLIHPVAVTIERLVRSELLMDDDAREAVHGARTTTEQTFTIPAQIKWEFKDDPQPDEGGIRSASAGYILCRPYDLDSIIGIGERLKRGDHITAMGVLTGLDLFLTGQQPMGHLPDQGGQSLLKFYFTDRRPVHQQGDLE